MKKRVVYVTSTYFPYGQAYSTRVVAFCKLFKSLGYSTHVIADYSLDEKKVSQTDDYSFEIAGDPRRLNRYFVNHRSSYAKLKEHLSRHDVAFVIINANCFDRFSNVSKLCRSKRIPLLLEICEWWNFNSLGLGQWDPRSILFLKHMSTNFRNVDGVIAISRLLRDHFSGLGVPTIRVPTILDTKIYKASEQTNNDRIRLVFAGSIGGNKETFKNIMLALHEMEEKSLFDFHIYGANRAQILRNIGNDRLLIESVDDVLEIKGKVPQSEIHDALQNADYEIFIRPERRSSHAGFPTKLAESMVAGTPVITNDTGDIGLYLKTGENGYLLKDSSPGSIKEALEQVVHLNSKKIREMRISARKTAEENFDYTAYVQKMRDFIETVS